MGMNDDAVTNSQVPVTSSDDQNQQAIQQNQQKPQDQSQQQTPVQPVQASVSTGVKEHEGTAAVSEFVKASAEVSEQELHPEVSEAGIEQVSDHPNSQILSKIGVQLSKEATPVVTEPTGAVTFASVAQAQQDYKTHSWKDAIKWVAAMFIRQEKQKRFEEFNQKKAA